MSSSFSYIIPYRDEPSRRKNLFFILSWLKNLDGEIIIVEQDTQQKLNLSKFDVKHVFTPSNRLFNKSWACNVGYKLAENDKIVFADSDIVINQADLLNALKLLDEYQVVSPYDSIKDLTFEETITFQETKSWPQDKENFRPGINLSGGVVMFKRADFELINGWCEEFEGWGGEDDFMTWKVEAWLTNTLQNSTALHLWHQMGKLNEDAYEKNLDILRRCEEFSSDEIVNWIFDESTIIGDPNKYSS